MVAWRRELFAAAGREEENGLREGGRFRVLYMLRGVDRRTRQSGNVNAVPLALRRNRPYDQSSVADPPPAPSFRDEPPRAGHTGTSENAHGYRCPSGRRHTRNYTCGWPRPARVRPGRIPSSSRASPRCPCRSSGSNRKCSGSKIKPEFCAEAGTAKAIAAVRAEKRSVFGSAAVFIYLLPSLREHQDQELSPPDAYSRFNLEQIQNCGG